MRANEPFDLIAERKGVQSAVGGKLNSKKMPVDSQFHARHDVLDDNIAIRTLENSQAAVVKKDYRQALTSEPSFVFDCQSLHHTRPPFASCELNNQNVEFGYCYRIPYQASPSSPRETKKELARKGQPWMKN